MKMENLQVEVVEVEGLELTKRQSYMNQAILRMGNVTRNNFGSLMTVDEYNNSQDIWVRFIESGNLVHTTWGQFSNRSVKNPYDKTIYGVGYIGEGKYKPIVNGKATSQYKTWSAMIQRCYSVKFQEKNPTYKGCSVDEGSGWYNFQNFAAWYDENYYEVNGFRTDLDKDILIKGNKVYSPDTCVFVPQFMNTLFVSRTNQRGNLPIGAKRSTVNPKKFESFCRNNTGKKIYLGFYNTPEEAFNAYKNYKENFIKQVANEYRELIPVNLYNALMSYTVEITD